MRENEQQLRAWMLQGLDGDAAAHEALLRVLVPLLRGFFGRRMRNTAADVEDLVQETFTPQTPGDVAASANGQLLFTLNSGTGTVGVFAINQASGTLTSLGEQGHLPAGAGINGIAGY